MKHCFGNIYQSGCCLDELIILLCHLGMASVPQDCTSESCCPPFSRIKLEQWDCQGTWGYEDPGRLCTVGPQRMATWNVEGELVNGWHWWSEAGRWRLWVSVFVFSETPDFVLKPSFFVLFVLLGIKMGFWPRAKMKISFHTCRGQWLS